MGRTTVVLMDTASIGSRERSWSRESTGDGRGAFSRRTWYRVLHLVTPHFQNRTTSLTRSTLHHSRRTTTKAFRKSNRCVCSSPSQPLSWHSCTRRCSQASSCRRRSPARGSGSSDEELQFTPKDDWPVDGAFSVRFAEEGSARRAGRARGLRLQFPQPAVRRKDHARASSIRTRAIRI